MSKRKNKLGTKSRTFYLPKSDLVDQWFSNQDNSGVSINDGIILKIEEYGTTDYALAIAQRFASIDNKFKVSARTEDNQSKPKVKEKRLRTAALYNEGPVLEWINAQKSLSSSISLLIIDLIAQFGTDDLPSTLAWLNGKRNKYLNETILARKGYEEKTELQSQSPRSNNQNIISPSSADEINTQTNDDSFDLSILHDKDSFN